MGRKSSPQRRQLHRDMTVFGVKVETHRPFCEYAEKAIYNSEHDAKRSARGRAHSKDMRPYRCAEFPGHWHLTKDRKVRW